jgi:hypothetical protein
MKIATEKTVHAFTTTANALSGSPGRTLSKVVLMAPIDIDVNATAAIPEAAAPLNGLSPSDMHVGNTIPEPSDTTNMGTMMAVIATTPDMIAVPSMIPPIAIKQ